MKVGDIEKVKVLIENIEFVERECKKIVGLSQFTATHDENDIAITIVSINGYGLKVPLDELMNLIKSASYILNKEKANLIKELENV